MTKPTTTPSGDAMTGEPIDLATRQPVTADQIATSAPPASSGPAPIEETDTPTEVPFEPDLDNPDVCRAIAQAAVALVNHGGFNRSHYTVAAVIQAGQ